MEKIIEVYDVQKEDLHEKMKEFERLISNKNNKLSESLQTFYNNTSKSKIESFNDDSDNLKNFFERIKNIDRFESK